MDTKEQAQSNETRASVKRSRTVRFSRFILLAAGLACGGAAFLAYSLCGSDSAPVPQKTEPKGLEWSYDDVFPNWPKDRKPDLVIVITGQTYGYLQKCGCSDPQKGGLERRFNLFEGLRSQGIEVVPLDLGDVAPQVAEDNKILHNQALLKYQVAMRSMKALGYRAVGLGKEEFALGLHEALAEFSLQKGGEQPRLLSANLIGFLADGHVVGKKQAFPAATGADTSVGDWEVVPTKSKINVGVVGIVGDPIIKDVKQIDAKMVFAEPPKTNTAKVVNSALDEMDKHQAKPELKVLLYSGPADLAKKAAVAFPQFQIVVCRSEESEPPSAPIPVAHKKNANSMVIAVGHRGQNIGVVGVFKKPAGGFDLEYQRVTLTPEFETPPGKEKENLILEELERYSKLVKDRGYLLQNRRGAHPLQVTNPLATYVGSASCVGCHNGPVAEGVDNTGPTWTASKHAKAYSALMSAQKPSQRHFDGECIRCHTVGYDYKTGFVDAVRTPNLMNVGCENCHGPGSAHVAAPNNKALAAELTPWKVNGQGLMPTAQELKEYLEETDPAKKQQLLTPLQTQVMLRVDRTCQTCHNSENDPHFKIESFWPKIAHSRGRVAVKPVGGDAPKAETPKGKDEGPSLVTPPPVAPLPLPKP